MIDLDKYTKFHSPGYVIEVYKSGKISEKIVGDREVWPVRKVCNSDTLYDIASLTKVYTAVLAYIANEEGYLDLESSVSDVDNRFLNLKCTRVIDLLSHNQEIWTDGYLGNAKSREEFEWILFSARVKSDHPTYVDVHYIILSTILEKVYGMPFERILNEKVLKKLGLEKTTVNPSGENIAVNDEAMSDIGLGIVHDKKSRVARGFGITTGHAAIFTTGRELLEFLKSFLDGSLLKAETIKKMLGHGEQRYNNMGVRYYGSVDKLGDVPLTASRNTIVFSGYTGPVFLVDFERRIIIIVMCNVLHNSKLDRLERKHYTDRIVDEIFNQVVIRDEALV